jgi:fatty-acyl-CoA synthase
VDEPAEDDVISHVRNRLAAYKALRPVVYVDTIGRAPNGKVDDRRLSEHAVATV